MEKAESNNRVLIIDDDEFLRCTLSDTMELYGYDTLQAKDGFEGLALLRENPVPLALVDLDLPDMSGIEVLDRIRAGNPGTQAIILTGNASLESAIEATNKGAFSFLKKPYDIDQLLVHVRRAIEKQRTEEALRASEERLRKKNEELERAYSELKQAQSRILQQDKMASIGQLAAGVAHEINTPTGFILSNLDSLRKYASRLDEFIASQSEVIEELARPGTGREDALKAEERVRQTRRALKIDHILGDIRNVVEESMEGAQRIKSIVGDLSSFSHVNEADYKPSDINAGLESTVNMVWNELKCKAVVKREFGVLPLTVCNIGQLNQAFMNILINAAHAIEKEGEIGIRTWHEEGSIFVALSDTGCGIPEPIVGRIFEPFFTTREVGQGTGLGLSIAYDIIGKHSGEIRVESEVGKGTTFVIKIPVTTRDR